MHDYRLPRVNTVLENARWAGLLADWEADIARAAESVHADVPLSRLYSLALYLLLHEDYDAKLFRYWPDPDAAMGASAPLVYLLLSLDCVGRVRRLHAEQAVPAHITRCTCTGIGSKAYDYLFFHGRPGTMKWALWWFRHHVKGELYRVGRLEFMLKQLSPEASASTDKELLRALELSPGDYVLDIHIPGGGALTLETVCASLTDGLTFFDSLHPHTHIKGFESVSWIFSPDLEAAYPPGANLLRLRDRVHLFPVQSRQVEGLPFIFGTFSENPNDWPQTTSVQRKLTRHISAGGRFRMSGMLLSRTELPGFCADTPPAGNYSRHECTNSHMP